MYQDSLMSDSLDNSDNKNEQGLRSEECPTIV
jgi:hypothetical protein